eukprot:m.238080 g.238080  ORF g.238080 m.238080 type:complete len:605 (+) comp13244_c0_seq1:33-1847(+)
MENLQELAHQQLQHCADLLAVCRENPVPTAVAAGTAVLLGSWSTLFGSSRKRVTINFPKAADPSWTSTRFVSEQVLPDPADPSRIQCFDKSTGAVLQDSVPSMSEADVKGAVARARAAQQEWVKSSYWQRKQVLLTLLDFVVENQDAICRVASRDTGKTMVDGAFGEILTTCEKIRWVVEHGEAALKPEYRDVGPLTVHKTARVEYQPLGVLAALVSWNYPFHNLLGQIISAIFAGNAIVVKVSEYVTWSSQFYITIVQKILATYGHSPDLVQIVVGFAPTGVALINSGIDKLTFIGSPQVGKLVMAEAAKTLTPVVLELGGKDAAIVCEDCDFNQVVGLTLRGTFQNCGQNCIGLERLVVLEPIYDKFVAVMQERVTRLSQGAPLEGNVDCGAMTMGARATKEIQALVEASVRQGARLLAGGHAVTRNGKGTFFEPTLLVDVTPEMDIARNEVFGPVMVILKAKNDADAQRIVNASEYGLGSSVFSLNYARAERIAAGIRAGMCNINDFGINYLCQSLPFGGVKISGFDRFAGVEGLRGCCLLRAVTSDRFPLVRTTIPGPLQYPIKTGGAAFCQALVQMMYGNGLLQRAKGLFNLAAAGLKS